MNPSRFIAAQGAAFAGTVADFLVTIGAVEMLHIWYLPATMLGNVAGGITNFYLGRHHVFGARHGGLSAQAGRYLLVWTGSLLLNAGGVYLLTHYLGLNYLMSKVLVGLLVSLGFNYGLQLHFVFRKS